VRTWSRVSWQLPTWIESMVLVAGLARLGAVQNPILPIYREREVGFVTGQAESELLVVPGSWRGFDYAAMARAIAAEREALEVLVVDRALPEGEASVLPPVPDITTAAEAPLRWLFYTSGTTAEPKGAQHTDHTLAHSGGSLCSALELCPDDRVGLVFPFTHIGGIGWLLAGLLSGCAQIVVEAFDPAETPGALARHGMTQGTAGTVFHQAYLAAQRAHGSEPLFPAVRSFPGGGAPKPPQLHADVKRELGGAGIVSGYGLTECPIVVMNHVGNPDEKLARTEGRPTEGVTLRLVKHDGTPAAPGEEGEVRVRGPQLCKGYVDAALDEAAFDEEGFFRTGDLGALDTDGFLTITGRLKDVIIRKGENISAKEVEDHLFAHPAVADVAVVGLPDPELGERACAVVVTAPDATPLGFAQMSAFLRERGLMVQKIPERLEHADALPRNPSGKVLKNELRDKWGRT